MSNSLWLHQYQFHFICSKQQGIWLPSDHANVTYTRTSQHHLQLLFGHKMVWVQGVYQMTQRGLDCTASKCSTILSKCSINKPLSLVTLLLSFQTVITWTLNSRWVCIFGWSYILILARQLVRVESIIMIKIQYSFSSSIWCQFSSWFCGLFFRNEHDHINQAVLIQLKMQ